MVNLLFSRKIFRNSPGFSKRRDGPETGKQIPGADLAVVIRMKGEMPVSPFMVYRIFGPFAIHRIVGRFNPETVEQNKLRFC